MTTSPVPICPGAPAASARRRTASAAVAFVGTVASLATFFIAAGAPTPLLPIYEQHWHFAPWLITVAFGAYAIGLLAAVLVLGRLSDHLGRRPVLLSAVILELASMVMFLLAPDITWLIVARVLQGIATGGATAAFGAAIIELAPDHRKKLGASFSGAAPAGGLAVGALLAGAVAQFDDAAALTVWGILTLLMAAATAFLWFLPETSSPRPGAVASLRPQIAVPAIARRQFAVTSPAQVGGWMFSALFMGLMPIILATVFHIHSPLVAGATAFITPAAASVASILGGRMSPQRLSIVGGIAVMVGAAAVVVAVLTATMPLLWVGGAIGGAGFGSTFTGGIRLLAENVPGHQRAGLLSALYLVAYLAFGVPAILAGAFMASVGLAVVAIAFAVVIVVASAIGVAGQVGLDRRLTREKRAAIDAE